jgi:RHS repeat-associated protein
VSGAVTNGILARTSSGGTTAWYLTDNLGSVRDVVSSAGSELNHIVYDSFGDIVTETDAANGDRFAFAGMEYDSTTGQYYDRARYYDSALGCFTAQDPLGFSAGGNDLYLYVANDPTDGTDVSGMAPQVPVPPLSPIDIEIGWNLVTREFEFVITPGQGGAGTASAPGLPIAPGIQSVNRPVNKPGFGKPYVPGQNARQPAVNPFLPPGVGNNPPLVGKPPFGGIRQVAPPRLRRPKRPNGANPRSINAIMSYYAAWNAYTIKLQSWQNENNARFALRLPPLPRPMPPRLPGTPYRRPLLGL